MEKKYLYLDKHGFDIYVLDRKLTEEERYSEDYELPDILIGEYDNEKDLADEIRLQFYWGYTAMENDDYEYMIKTYHPAYIKPFDVGVFIGREYDQLFVHGCSLEEGIDRGDYIEYPKKHKEIWDEIYKSWTKEELKDTGYVLGRVVYRKRDNKTIVYYDKSLMDRLLKRDDEKYFSLKQALGAQKDIIYKVDRGFFPCKLLRKF